MINLLASHEIIYQQKRQQFLYILYSCVVVTIIIITIWSLGIKHQIKLKSNENALITQKLNIINAKVYDFKKAYAIDLNSAQILAIAKKLQHLQLGVTMLLQKLPNFIPKNLYLSEIIKDKLHLILKGNSNLYKNIDKFIANINKSNWLKDPILSEFSVSDKTHINQFILQCGLS